MIEEVRVLPNTGPPIKELIEKAEALARNVHAGQVDKTGHPYIEHIERVAGSLTEYKQKIVAWLHDTIEDTEVTDLDLIDMGFGQDIIEAVIALTRREDETYEEFIERVKPNVIAKQVKIADLRDNLRDGCPESLQKRYRIALVTLGADK